MRSSALPGVMILLLSAGAAAAEEPRVSASVDAERLGAEDTLVLTLRAEGGGPGRSRPPR